MHGNVIALLAACVFINRVVFFFAYFLDLRHVTYLDFKKLCIHSANIDTSLRYWKNRNVLGVCLRKDKRVDPSKNVRRKTVGVNEENLTEDSSDEETDIEYENYVAGVYDIYDNDGTEMRPYQICSSKRTMRKKGKKRDVEGSIYRKDPFLKRIRRSILVETNDMAIPLKEFLYEHDLTLIHTSCSTDMAFYEALRAAIIPLVQPDVDKDDPQYQIQINTILSYSVYNCKFQLLMYMITRYPQLLAYDYIDAIAESKGTSFLAYMFKMGSYNTWGDSGMLFFASQMWHINITLIVLDQNNEINTVHYGRHNNIKDADTYLFYNDANHYCAVGMGLHCFTYY